MLAFSIAIALALFFFLALSILLFRESSGEEIKRRLESIRNLDSTEEGEDQDEIKRRSLYQRTIGQMFSNIMAFFSKFAPSALPGLMEEKIMLAGKQGVWKVKPLVGIWFFSMMLWGALGFLLVNKSSFPLIGKVFVAWACFLFGAFFPFGILNRIIRKRQEMLMIQLPDVLDLLSISVQAGLSLDAAIRQMVERMKGPLIDEFRRMLRDTRMGMTRRRSMQLMSKRCGVQEIQLFVMSVTQSERLGASMSDTLQIQADNMRDVRRQRARNLAMKAPLKIIFPLVFCIFPALFLVVLAPSVLSLMQSLK